MTLLHSLKKTHDKDNLLLCHLISEQVSHATFQLYQIKKEEGAESLEDKSDLLDKIGEILISFDSGKTNS